MDNVMTNDELKACLVDVLVDVTNYCDEHNLKYVLAYGTLLGAVRHKGFIPWDDDIDILMPREDYDKLHTLVKLNPIKSNYILESITAGNSAYPFAKVVDTNTKIVNSHSSLVTSLWIDIFPVDGVTQDMADNAAKINEELYTKYKLLAKSANRLKDLDSFKTKLISVAAKLSGSAEHYGRKVDKYARKYKMSDCPYAADISWGGIVFYMNSNDYFDNRIKLSFEGKEFYAPENYEEHLTRIYGDYMKLPPEDQRYTHDIMAVRKSC